MRYPQNRRNLKLEVSYKSIFIVLGIAFWILALIKLWSIFILIIVSLIFMAALLPTVDWLVRHKIPRLVAVLMILVVVLGSIAGIFAIVIPASISEFKDLKDHLPDKALELQNFLANFGIKDDLQKEAQNIDWNRLISGGAAISLGQRVLEGFLTFLPITTLTVYMLADARRISNFVYTTFNEKQREHGEKLLTALRLVVGGYIRVRILT
ncbi:MAG: AI-2E family transporter [Dehalococcoidia bacterium]|nr:AI-2E family transporter [Dehalococcoidia bacterium]